MQQTKELQDKYISFVEFELNCAQYNPIYQTQLYALRDSDLYRETNNTMYV